MGSQAQASPKPAPAAVAKQGKSKRKGNKLAPSPMDAGSVSDSITNKNSPRGQKTPKHVQSNSTQKPRHQAQVSSGGLDTPSSTGAYAAPKFQNSPAASSLPIPKLFARQMAAKAASESGSSSSANSSPASQNASPIPVRRAVKSPLDVLFNADRDEKKRQQEDEQRRMDVVKQSFQQMAEDRRQSPHYSSASPLQHSVSGPNTPAAMYDQQNNYFYGNRQLSPMFAAARGSDTSSSPQPQHPIPAGYPQYGSPYHAPYQQFQPYPQHQYPPPPQPAFMSPQMHAAVPQQAGINPGFNPQQASPNNPQNGNNNQQVAMMEEDLRRMLKMQSLS